jgi:hypothetical protein
MEFSWSDAHDNKYFHVLDTETRELTPVRNPHTLHARIRYDDTDNDYLDYQLDDIEDKFVKVVVMKKTNTFMFDQFIDRLQNKRLLELKIAENFDEFVGKNVDDTNITIDDTSELLYNYVDAVDTDLDKARIKTEMAELMTEAQTLEVM